MLSLRVEYVVACLSQLAIKPPAPAPATDEQRLAKANQGRAAIHAALDKGIQPAGARAEWIRGASGRVVNLLGELAEAFGNANPTDVATVGDLLDVVATVRQHLVDEDE